jgi:hypothetical protein
MKCQTLGVVCVLLAACSTPQKGAAVDWAKLSTSKPIAQGVPAAAAVASAAAVRALLEQDPGLFRGCAEPAQGVDATVYQGEGFYFVTLEERFDRCGDSRERVMDWNAAYAVSPDGRVLERRRPNLGPK